MQEEHIMADLQKWDEELPVAQSTVALVSAFARKLTEQLLPLPTLFPTLDGFLDMSWEKQGVYVSVPVDSYFFGEVLCHKRKEHSLKM